MGSGLTPDLSYNRPVDVLVLNWRRKHAAFYITVTSPLIPSILTAASLCEGAAAEEAETRKHKINDPECLELGWVYTAYPNYLYMYICTFANVCVYVLSGCNTVDQPVVRLINRIPG